MKRLQRCSDSSVQEVTNSKVAPWTGVYDCLWLSMIVYEDEDDEDDED